MQPSPHDIWQAPISPLLDIRLDADSIDMIGPSNTGSHYSLTGVVRLVFPNLHEDHLGRLRKLISVVLIFEGQSEYWDDLGRYTPCRMHRQTVPITEQHDYIPPAARQGSIMRELAFELRVPGWLPPTQRTDRTATGYGLKAYAIVGWCDRAWDGTWTNVLSPEIIATTVSGYTPLRIRRHKFPSALSPGTEVSMRKHRFTSKVLSMDIDIVAPSWVDMHSPKGIEIIVTLTGRSTIRAVDDGSRRPSKGGKKGEAVADLLELGMGVEEVVSERSEVSRTFSAQNPLSTLSINNMALIAPTGCPNEPPFCDLASGRSLQKIKCYTAADGSQLAHVFPSGDAITSSPRSIRARLSPNVRGTRLPRGDVNACFLNITHVLKVAGFFLLPNGAFITEHWDVPIRLGSTPATAPGAVSTAPPPYVCVFTEDGVEREPDPLPLYSARGFVEHPLQAAQDAVEMNAERRESTSAECGASEDSQAGPERSELGRSEERREAERSEERTEMERSEAAESATAAQVEASPANTRQYRDSSAQCASDETAAMDVDYPSPSSSARARTPECEPSTPSSSPSAIARSVARRQSAAAGLNPRARKMFEQWAREGAPSPSPARADVEA